MAAYARRRIFSVTNPTAHFQRLVLLLLAFSSWVSPRSMSPCADSDSKDFDLDTCLEAIKTGAEDRHKYWFGDTYSSNCHNSSAFVAECFNPYANREDSLVSRIFRRRFYDREKLSTFLKITYKTYTGRYDACGHTFEISESRTVDVDPLNYEEDLMPFQLLTQPKITWKESTATELHTLVMYDAGYVTVKALYVNVPGSDLEMGQTVVPYEPPLNPTSNKNPYVFLLFIQPDRLELSSKWLHRLSRRDEEQFEDFLSTFNLEGPVGLSWLTVRSDPYAAEVKRSRGFMNTCARFIGNALKNKQLPFVSENTTELSVNIDVTFEVPALKVNSCCHLYSYPAKGFKPNPLGDREVKAAFVRTDAKHRIHFTKSTAFSDRSRDFKGQLHTFAVVDLDIPSRYGSRAKPFNHWLVTNIEDGNFSTGEHVLDYLGPAPPHPYFHTYYFLLYRQSKRINATKGDYSFRNCPSIFYGRCGFHMAPMIQDGGMELVGATWMLVKNDEFVRRVYLDLGGKEEEVCSGVPGYKVNCNASKTLNTTTRFISDALKNKQLPFVPENKTELSVNIDVTFEVPALQVNSCCYPYSYPANGFKPNPLGDREVKAAFVRTDAKHRIHFTKSTAFSDRSRDFKGQLHTFAVVDLDIPSRYGSRAKPFNHWLVTNIEDGNFSTGEHVLDYLGPAPPHPYFHTYYFLLYRQSKRINATKGDYSFRNCPSIFYGRCGFHMAPMIQDGGMELVGATWMLVKNDEFVRRFYLDMGGKEEEVCAGVPGYKVNCNASKTLNTTAKDNSHDAAVSLFVSFGQWVWMILGQSTILWVLNRRCH